MTCPLPFVSVVVPTHGRCALLGRLLRSLLAQSWPADRMEIIVVHNWTDDGTDRMVAGMAASAPMPLAYHRTAFSGPGPSRHFGAGQARGAVIAFIDDDCTATAGWIEAGVAALADGVAVVQGCTLPNPGQKRSVLEHTVTVTGPTAFFETCNIFYDAAAFRAVGGFPAAFRERFYGEDTALGWEAVRHGYRTGFAAGALVHHEVFRISGRAWLLEPRRMRHWPFLARAYPAIREKLFLRIFLSRLTAAFDLFVLGVLGGVLLHPLLLVSCAPYLALRFLDGGRFRRPHLLIARFLFGLPRAGILAATLVGNSVRARSLVI